MDYAGLIFDESFHYVDHLAPFCVLADCPLIVCEESLAELARRYYPGLKVIEADPFRLQLPKRIVSCDTRPLLQAAFPQLGDAEIYWLPHGNSDKGWTIPFFEALQSEICLVYGQKMIDFMDRKNVRAKIIRVGNFRKRYFLKYRDLYRRTVEKEIAVHLPKSEKNFLYAPTWEDAEGNGSFWKVFPVLLGALPNDCNLWVKIHPNTRRRFSLELEALQGRFGNKPNLFLLPEFPPVYPLLDFCSAYIGDMSSIGYDFLTFDKPLYFIHPSKGEENSRFLYRCGLEIPLDRIERLFSFEQPQEIASIRREVSRYTFDASPENFKEIFHR